jgi:hypothetical protein
VPSIAIFFIVAFGDDITTINRPILRRSTSRRPKNAHNADRISASITQM